MKDTRPANRAARWIGVLACLALLLVAASALARPGGGQSYGGGSSSGGGGGSSGGGDGGGIAFLILLCFEHPVIGIPLLLIVIGIAVARSRMEAKQKAWQTSAGAVPYVQQRMQSALVPRSQLDQIRAIDPAFSNVLFEDFVYFLYAEIQRARGKGVAPLAAFLSPHLAQTVQDPNIADVHGVIIGAMRILRFSGVGGAMVNIELEFETNYVEVYRQAPERRFYVVDRMTLGRSASAKSRPLDRARTLDCPNCGASIENLRGTQCAYCREEVGGGRFDWNVESFMTMKKEMRGPLLTSDVEEVGTNFPTRVDPGATTRINALNQRDPSFNFNTFTQRVGFIFAKLQEGWSGRDAAKIRPFVSDNLFQSMMYWIDLYLQNKCRNINEGAHILRVDLANVLSDATYDAITVRVFASGMDYTIGDDGRMLSGSRSKARTYSEYWTLIRGATPKGQSKGDQCCPNCGAELKITMVGNCEYCKVKVTAGEFDWVLSRIEQDESYTG